MLLPKEKLTKAEGQRAMRIFHLLTEIETKAKAVRRFEGWEEHAEKCLKLHDSALQKWIKDFVLSRRGENNE